MENLFLFPGDGDVRDEELRQVQSSMSRFPEQTDTTNSEEFF